MMETQSRYQRKISMLDIVGAGVAPLLLVGKQSVKIIELPICWKPINI